MIFGKAEADLCYCRMRQPVLKIHQMIARHRTVNPAMANRLSPMGTSANPKNDQRKPETRYTTGLKNEIVCHTGGSIEIE